MKQKRSTPEQIRVFAEARAKFDKNRTVENLKAMFAVYPIEFKDGVTQCSFECKCKKD